MPIWKRPYPLQWEKVHDAKLEPIVDKEISKGKPVTVAEVCRLLGHAVGEHFQAQGSTEMLLMHCGRRQQTTPKICYHAVAPLKPSRSSEVAVTYLGENFQRTKWCRQVSRLQSYCNYFAGNP